MTLLKEFLYVLKRNERMGCDLTNVLGIFFETVSLNDEVLFFVNKRELQPHRLKTGIVHF